MPTFPIPVFVGCILAYTAIRLWQGHHRNILVAVLIGICAVQSMIIALAQHYEVSSMRILQPIIASLIPASTWIAYQNANIRAPSYQDLQHLLGTVLVIGALLSTPQFLDLLIPALFVFYGTLILYCAKNGADTQPNALLSSGDLPAQLWTVIGITLIASTFSDVLIVLAIILGYPELRPWIISIFSVGNLFVIGILSISPHMETKPNEPTQKADAPMPADEGIWDRIQTYTSDKKPYLDPDLTLSRLSRMMGIPVKDLSSTINRATGESVSRYINAARITTAQALMQNSESITDAMFQSGFNTKSNFNREFLRVSGTSPSVWLSTKQSG